MPNSNSRQVHGQILTSILRLTGGVSLLALIFVFVPYSWMNGIHQQLGMGQLPNSPVVGYLARSTSAFYALFGSLFIFLSFDVQKYQSILIFVSFTIAFLGLILLFVDWFEGMPFFWKIWEGPFFLFWGYQMFYTVQILNFESSFKLAKYIKLGSCASGALIVILSRSIKVSKK